MQDNSEVINLNGLKPGDKVRVVTENGSTYEFTLEIFLNSEHPGLAHVISQMTRQSEHEIRGVSVVPDGESTEVSLVGSCTGILQQGGNTVHQGGGFYITVGMPIGFIDSGGNSIITGVVSEVEVKPVGTEAKTPQASEITG